jgi:hypothetical protein
MGKTLLAALLVATLFFKNDAAAQHGRLDSLFAKGDTTAMMDSLMQGFDAFLDSLSQPKSFFSIGTGIGNRTFSIKNNALNAQEATTSQLSFTPTLGYYHKNGLGLSLTGFLTSLNNQLRFYQYAATPSYDYITRKISAGISYTRYFGKDTATLHSSPYDNDLYAYFNVHRGNWRFGVAPGYATGNFSDKISYADSIQHFNNLLQKYEWLHFRKTVESKNQIRDFSLSASIRRDFEWYGLFSKTDNLSASLTSYLVTGTSRIKTSTHINYAIRTLTLARFKKTYNDAGGNGFQVQSAALSASLFYTIGKLNLQPIWFMDYYFQDTDQHFSQVFSFSVAYNF